MIKQSDPQQLLVCVGNDGGEQHNLQYQTARSTIFSLTCDSTYDMRIMSTDLTEERHGCDDCGDCSVKPA